MVSDLEAAVARAKNLSLSVRIPITEPPDTYVVSSRGNRPSERPAPLRTVETNRVLVSKA